jgi:hypothetical protein
MNLHQQAKPNLIYSVQIDESPSVGEVVDESPSAGEAQFDLLRTDR